MPKNYKTCIPTMLQWPMINGKSLLLLIFSVNTPEDVCHLDCPVCFTEVKINKMATNSLSTSALHGCPFVRLYFLWKSGPHMSRVYGHGRWLPVAKGRDCCVLFLNFLKKDRRPLLKKKPCIAQPTLTVIPLPHMPRLTYISWYTQHLHTNIGDTGVMTSALMLSAFFSPGLPSLVSRSFRTLSTTSRRLREALKASCALGSRASRLKRRQGEQK